MESSILALIHTCFLMYADVPNSRKEGGVYPGMGGASYHRAAATNPSAVNSGKLKRWLGYRAGRRQKENRERTIRGVTSMPNYSMDQDAGYWQAPERFRVPFERSPATGVKSSYFPLGDPNDDNTPIAVVLQMEPGFVIAQHCHPYERVEVVMRGTLSADGRVYRPGDVLTAKANEFYGPKTAGKEGCTTLEVFANASGATYRITKDDAGRVTKTNLVEAFSTAFAHLLEKKGAADAKA